MYFETKAPVCTSKAADEGQAKIDELTQQIADLSGTICERDEEIVFVKLAIYSSPHYCLLDSILL